MIHVASQAEPSSSATTQTSFGKGFVTGTWYFVALSRHVTNGSLRRFEIMGQPLLLGRSRDGEVYGLRDICPHDAVPLSAGRIIEREGEAETIECACDGWRFRTDGVCAQIPSLADGHAVEVESIRVRKYHLGESQGMVFVWMPPQGREDDTPADGPPVFEGADDHITVHEWMDFGTHIDHAIVALLDPSRGSVLSKHGWGRKRGWTEQVRTFAPRDFGWAMVRHQPSSGRGMCKLFGGAPAIETGFRLPGFHWEHVRLGSHYVVVLTLLTPVNEARTHVTRIIWSDHWAFGLAQPVLKAGIVACLQKESAFIELQNKGLNQDPDLVWLDGADSQAKWYRAIKREWHEAAIHSRAFVNPVSETVLRWNGRG